MVPYTSPWAHGLHMGPMGPHMGLYGAPGVAHRRPLMKWDWPGPTYKKTIKKYENQWKPTMGKQMEHQTETNGKPQETIEKPEKHVETHGKP